MLHVSSDAVKALYAGPGVNMEQRICRHCVELQMSCLAHPAALFVAMALESWMVYFLGTSHHRHQRLRVRRSGSRFLCPA